MLPRWKAPPFRGKQMPSEYDHRSAEQKWSQRWDRERTYSVDLHRAEQPYYNLMMFPYPSAEGLHVGNFFAFVGSDIHGRFMRAQGYDVFEPMGMDAFGIHSENYAMKVGEHPARLTPMSIERFREQQLKRLGAMFDWTHQVDSTDPGYYRWTQWVFVQLFKAGLAYQKEAPVNWCPSCKTVLANEQAKGGTCERCDATVAQRTMRQWFFRITAYAQQLLDNLDWIDWSPITKNIQRRWIGRSEGAEVTFPVVGCSDDLTVFTTRPDTLWGATYMVLAPEHPLAQSITTPERSAEARRYVEAAARRTTIEREDVTREKTGVFTGAYATNPVNDRRIPIWISDYVLMAYGTGAIMAVPAHDARDFEFATKFGLPIVPVISPDGQTGELTEAYVEEGVLVNSGAFSGTDSKTAIWQISDWLAERGVGRRAVNFRLHDWCISRQRYWGPPIPIVHCDACGAVPVPEDELPVRLPFVEDFKPDGSGKSPLARHEDFVSTTCPKCGEAAARETDVSDNFLDSAWYFFRYVSPDRDDVPFDRELVAKWLPVDMYIGGNEHALLHLMYTRFITMVFKDLGLIDFEEPFKRFRAHGLLIKDGAKMSKSKGNVINPDDYVEKYGVDTFRMHLMFIGPYQRGSDFRDAGIVGTRRFLERLWRYVTETEFIDEPVADPATLALVHGKIKKVTDDVAGLRYNTAIAALMELLNGLMLQPKHSRQCAKALLQLASPFAPFITHELWQQMGEPGMVGDAAWPQHDPAYVREETVEIAVQINGKVRDRIVVPADTPQAEVERVAFENPRVHAEIDSQDIERTVFVPNKLLNIVIGG